MGVVLLSQHVEVGAETPSEASDEPLWWPPHKIFGHHLAPLLAGLERRPAEV